MKKLNFIIKYGLALLLLSFYSCESWLNVTPSDRLSEEMLFNDREGFVKALNGVYIELNTNELYGRNLTAGALDVMDSIKVLLLRRMLSITMEVWFIPETMRRPCSITCGRNAMR